MFFWVCYNIAMRLGLVFWFNAGHSVHTPFHEHNFRVEIILEGKLINGMVGGLDFNVIRPQIEKIIKKLESKNLNKIMKIPTVENINRYIYKRLPKYTYAKVVLIRVWETENRFAEAYQNK
jgi:6-pyruvoyl-tetrahydropterin synthase